MSGVPFEQLPGFSTLFSTYCTRPGDLSAYFAADWQDEDSFRALAPAVQRPIDRDLADVLRHQNHRWENPVDGHIDALERDDALAVVTGQQVGVFGGPLYTFYKAATTVALARRLSDQLQRPVVPVFWLEGGDHDLEEVAHVCLPGREGVGTYWYDGHEAPAEGNLGSVGRLPFGEEINALRAALSSNLPGTEFTGAVLDDLFGGYREGVTFTDAFARSLAQMIGQGQLVLLGPEVSVAKRLVAPLFERTLLDHKAAQAAVEAPSVALQDKYHAQVQARPTYLFMDGAGGRQALRPVGVGFSRHGDGQSYSAARLSELIGSAPQRFSPNVALRPIVQDALVPTIAYVAGPGEIAYFAQLKGLYAWADVPMPIIYPRASITALEPGAARTMSRHDLGLDALDSGVDELLARLVMQGSSIDQAFDGASAKLVANVESLMPLVSQVDATLSRTAKGVGAAWQKELGRLRQRVVKAEKRRHETLRAQLTRCRHSVFPGGKLQERVLPTLYFLSKYGPRFLDLVREELSLETSQHQVIRL